MGFFSSFLALRTGCLLGLALVLAALCRMEQAELHARVTQTLEKLVSSLQDSGQGRMLQEVSSTPCSTWMGGQTDRWMEGGITAEVGQLRPGGRMWPHQLFNPPLSLHNHFSSLFIKI